MTLFEYIAVANSILLSFAVVRLLDALPPAFQSGRRDWTHLAFLVVLMWACAQYWWVSWSYATVSSWTYAKFLTYLTPPALLYSLARTLSPDPNAVQSFREYFDSTRRRFFALLAAYVVVLLFGSWIIAGVPLSHPLRVGQLVTVLAASSGVVVSNPRYHAVLAAFFLFAFGFLTLRIFAGEAPLPAPG